MQVFAIQRVTRTIIPLVLLGVVVDFYVFPLSFTFLHGINTKMILAALGIFFFTFRSIRNGEKINISIVRSCLLAFLFSLCCLFSATHFGTYDYAYAKYFISFFVWIFGAYAVCFFLRQHYGAVSFKTIAYYVAAVCVFQCVMAQLIDHYPAVKTVVNSIFEQGQNFVESKKRLYGVGASLDSGGIRLACGLIFISYIIADNIKNEIRTKELILLSISFIIITVYGNMIARTTTVGALLGLAYIGIIGVRKLSLSLHKKALIALFCVGVLVAAAVVYFSYLYRTNSDFNYQIRFAFEGFFNYFETGTFSTGSTDKLQREMIVWPKDSITWWIGTGKFDNWAFGTDVGYCRFILYCGLVGFSAFVIFFIYNSIVLAKHYNNFALLALVLFAAVMIIWTKVSTDIFQFYALLFCADGIIRDEELDEVQK